jgi:hypothetical protein
MRTQPEQASAATVARASRLRGVTARSRRIGSAAAALALGVIVLAAGCGGSKGGGGSSSARRAPAHPLTNTLDESYATLGIKTLAALPFSSDVGDDEDPDNVAAGMAEAKFYQALGATSGYTVLPANEVARVLATEKLTDAKVAFDKKWMNDPTSGDPEFIKKVAAVLKTDAVVAGAVDVWHQQPVDVTQTGTARTTVGVMIGVFHGATGKRLWLGRDENFKEAVRYSPNESGSDLATTQTRGQMDRSNLRTATGVYAPPDFALALDAVIPALAQAFPKRVQ